MEKNRLEAFSDGVLAIIITIMVLELKVPHEDTANALLHLWPVFLSYVLSFVLVGVYWNNHHHMLQAATSISGGILWANLHLLFWLSLVPFTTGWMGENHFSRLPVVAYGINQFAAALAYYILQVQVAEHHGPNNPIREALGSDVKGKSSLVLILAGTLASWFFNPWIGFAFYNIVAIMWLVPDRRMERVAQNKNHSK